MRYFHTPNPELESRIDCFFSLLADVNSRFYQDSLSIVLLGSLSRNEASWELSESGKPQMLSDIEFFTAYDDGFSDFREFTSHIEKAKSEAFGSESLNLFHIDNTFIRKSRLGHLERKLLIYDASVFGKCVVGSDVSACFPEITIHNINMHDIRDVIAHRIFSVLYYGRPLKENGLEGEYRYSVAKNSLDLMTVILASKGYLESGFARRLNLLDSLSPDGNLNKYFHYCLSVKLNEEAEEEYTVEEMEQLFISIISELNCSFRVPVSNSLRNAEALFRHNLGIIRRMMKNRHFSSTKKRHLESLISTFNCGKELSPRQLRDNLVLYGYPEI